MLMMLMYEYACTYKNGDVYKYMDVRVIMYEYYYDYKIKKIQTTTNPHLPPGFSIVDRVEGDMPKYEVASEMDSRSLLYQNYKPLPVSL